MTARVLVAALVALALAACGDEAASRPAAPLPERLVPDQLRGLSIAQEPSAKKAFAAAGDSSLTAHGAVWTLRQDGAVRGALQVGVLRPEFDTEDIEVRRGIRDFIENGRYRWFKVDDQWVGVQELPELRLYLWFPPRGDLYQVLQLQPDVPDQEQLLTDLLAYQEVSA